MGAYSIFKVCICQFKSKLEILEGSFFVDPPGIVEDLKKLHFA